MERAFSGFGYGSDFLATSRSGLDDTFPFSLAERLLDLLRLLLSLFNSGEGSGLLDTLLAFLICFSADELARFCGTASSELEDFLASSFGIGDLLGGAGVSSSELDEVLRAGACGLGDFLARGGGSSSEHDDF